MGGSIHEQKKEEKKRKRRGKVAISHIKLSINEGRWRPAPAAQ
jgi:hypothetical protein